MKAQEYIDGLTIGEIKQINDILNGSTKISNSNISLIDDLFKVIQEVGINEVFNLINEKLKIHNSLLHAQLNDEKIKNKILTQAENAQKN